MSTKKRRSEVPVSSYFSHGTCEEGRLIMINPEKTHEEIYFQVTSRVGPVAPHLEACTLSCLNWFIHDTLTSFKEGGRSYYVKLKVPAMVLLNAKNECFVVLVSNADEEYPTQIPMGVTYLD
jgi:hypothetical protein